MGKLFDLFKGQTFLSLSSFFSFKKKIQEYFAMCIPPWKTFKKQHFKVKFCIWGSYNSLVQHDMCQTKFQKSLHPSV